MFKSTALIIPTYNEADNITPLLEQIRKNHPTIPVYFIDSKSQDLTISKIQEHQKNDQNIHLITQLEKAGLGLAYLEAFSYLIKNTSITHVILMDADLSHDPKEISVFLKNSDTYDVVIGSRVVNSTTFQPENFFRNLVSKSINFYIHKKLQLPIRDYSSGFILFPLRNLQKHFSTLEKTKGYIFQAHLKYTLFKTGHTVIEIPIFFKKRMYGKSKLNLFVILEALFKTHKIPSYYRQ